MLFKREWKENKEEEEEWYAGCPKSHDSANVKCFQPGPYVQTPLKRAFLEPSWSSRVSTVLDSAEPGQADHADDDRNDVKFKAYFRCRRQIAFSLRALDHKLKKRLKNAKAAQQKKAKRTLLRAADLDVQVEESAAMEIQGNISAQIKLESNEVAVREYHGNEDETVLNGVEESLDIKKEVPTVNKGIMESFSVPSLSEKKLKKKTSTEVPSVDKDVKDNFKAFLSVEKRIANALQKLKTPPSLPSTADSSVQLLPRRLNVRLAPEPSEMGLLPVPTEEFQTVLTCFPGASQCSSQNEETDGIEPYEIAIKEEIESD